MIEKIIETLEQIENKKQSKNKEQRKEECTIIWCEKNMLPRICAVEGSHVNIIASISHMLMYMHNYDIDKCIKDAEVILETFTTYKEDDK